MEWGIENTGLWAVAWLIVPAVHHLGHLESSKTDAIHDRFW